MKPRIPIPVSHTRCPVQMHRDTLALVVVVSFLAGSSLTTWAIVAFLLKGGAR